MDRAKFIKDRAYLEQLKSVYPLAAPSVQQAQNFLDGMMEICTASGESWQSLGVVSEGIKVLAKESDRPVSADMACSWSVIKAYTYGDPERVVGTWRVRMDIRSSFCSVKVDKRAFDFGWSHRSIEDAKDIKDSRIAEIQHLNHQEDQPLTAKQLSILLHIVWHLLPDMFDVVPRDWQFNAQTKLDELLGLVASKGGDPSEMERTITRMGGELRMPVERIAAEIMEIIRFDEQQECPEDRANVDKMTCLHYRGYILYGGK